MRHYEVVVVLSPMISPDEAGRAWERIKGFLTNREAEIVHEERWGTRRLAYPVRKGQHQFLEGNYCLARFAAERSFNIELENYLKLDDQVLRSLVTATLPEDELAAHAAQTRAPRPPRPAPGMGAAGAPGGGAAPGGARAGGSAPAQGAAGNARAGGGPAPAQGGGAAPAGGGVAQAPAGGGVAQAPAGGSVAQATASASAPADAPSAPSAEASAAATAAEADVGATGNSRAEQPSE